MDNTEYITKIIRGMGIEVMEDTDATFSDMGFTDDDMKEFLSKLGENLDADIEIDDFDTESSIEEITDYLDCIFVTLQD